MNERTLTIIKFDDWALLFDGERFVSEGYDIIIDDLQEKTRWGPAYIRVVSADGTKLDDQISEAGGWSGGSLTEALRIRNSDYK